MGDNEQIKDQESGRADERGLVRLLKPVVFQDTGPGKIDSKYVSSTFYNQFGNSSLRSLESSATPIIGVTSASAGEGKTTVATNLAISFALADHRKTLIVDMNFWNPCLQAVFDLPQAPGLAEAMGEPVIKVFDGRIEGLAILTAGRPDVRASANRAMTEWVEHQHPSARAEGLSIESLSKFRDIFYSLREHFEVIVVDMAPLIGGLLPPYVVNLFDGILIVIDRRGTRIEEVEAIFKNVNNQRIVGFVMNRAM